METDDIIGINQQDLAELPTEVLCFLQAQETRIQQQTNTIDKLKEQLDWFRQQFKLSQHRKFAKSNESQQALQLSLFDEDDECVEQENQNKSNKETITYTRKKPNRASTHVDTSQLPRERCIIDLSDEEKQCRCGFALSKIGEESREEIKFQPAKLRVIEHVRYKYTCRRCDAIKTPPAVMLPIPKSKASAELLAEIAVNKYRYHLPLYHQRKMLAQHGMTIADNTLGGWVMKSAEQLEPLCQALSA